MRTKQLLLIKRLLLSKALKDGSQNWGIFAHICVLETAFAHLYTAF